jgi:hypothetical protein
MRAGLLIIVIGAFFSCQSDEADAPEIKTAAATGIGLSQALLQGEIKEVGPIKPILYGFIWSTTAGVSVISAERKVLLGEAFEGDRVFSSQVSGLQQNTEYYFRAFATNQSQTSIYYGDEFSFKTTQPTQYVKTLVAENVTNASAQLKGEIIALNELDAVSYGFAWSQTPFTSVLQAQTILLGQSETPLVYQTTLNTLPSQTTFYYRAFVSNESGTLLVYGDQQTFTTLNP